MAADISMKREHVRSVLQLHQKKGTVWAIREALRLMDIEAEFVPWWQTGDNPYTFRLRAVIGGDYYKTRGREALMRNLRRAVNDAKSARSYMTQAEAFLLDREHQELYAGVKGSIGGNSRILIAHPETIDTLALTAGVLPLTGGSIRVRLGYPESAGMNVFAGVVSASEQGISISPDISEIEKLLAKFEERIYFRLDLCEHNIIIPVLDMMRRAQRLDDFIHDYSPKSFSPSWAIGTLPQTEGWERIRLRLPDDPLSKNMKAGTLPVISGHMAIRNDYPEGALSELYAGLTGSYGLDMYLGMSYKERKTIRSFIFSRTNTLGSLLYAGNITQSSGDIRTGLDLQPENGRAELYAGLTGSYGLDMYLGMSYEERKNIRSFIFSRTNMLGSLLYAGNITQTSGNIRTGLDLQAESGSTELKAGLTGAYGLDMYLGMSYEERKTIRSFIFSRTNTLTSLLYAGNIARTSGNIRTGLDLQPETGGAELYAETFGVFGLDEYIFIGDDVLQELLLQFEQRIFARIDEHEAKEDKAIEELSERLARLERLIEPED